MIRKLAYSFVGLGKLTVADNLGDNTLDESFTYDARRNLTTCSKGGGVTNYTYSAGRGAGSHAEAASGAASINYDPKGNMSTDGNRVPTWDAANWLQIASIKVIEIMVSSPG